MTRMRRLSWLLPLAAVPALAACAAATSTQSEALRIAPMPGADSVAVAGAIVRYAVQTGIGRWAGRPPEVVCVATAFGSFSDIRLQLDTVPRAIVPAEECALHSSADPPLAPLVRHVATLRHAVILRFVSLERASDVELTVHVQWEAGYHYGGDSQCAVSLQDGSWVVRACRAARDGQARR